jgi:hypothetical protein
MKLSTLHKLIVCADVALVLGIGATVVTVVQEKGTRVEELTSYRNNMVEQLKKIRPDAALGRRRTEYGANIKDGVLWPVKPPAPKVDENKPAPPPKAPVETVLKVLVVQYSQGSSPSHAYFGRKGSAADGKPDPLLPYLEGQVVEWAGGAVVKKIEPGRVVFLSDGREIALEPDPAPSTAGSAAAATPKVAGPIDNNTSTWIEWSVAKPTTITVTEMGARAFADKGDASLEGVRFSTETLEDGKAAVRLDAIPQDNVLRRGGAEEGDVLESINGVRMSTKAEVIAYAKNNPQTTRFEVRLRRKGVIMTRTVVVPRR